MARRPFHGTRLLMTSDTVGGVWDYAIELCSRLSLQGMEIVLATLGRRPSPAQREAASAIPGLTLEASDYRLEWMPDAGRDVPLSGEWLLDLEQRTRPDVVHLNGYVHAALPWEAPVLLVAHSCVLTWWRAVKGEPAPPEWDLYAERVRKGLDAAGAIVAPTASLLTAMEACYGPIPRARVIWNGRDPFRYIPRPKSRYVFSAGRLWDEAKNLAALQEVAPSLEWPIVAAGDWSRPEGGGERPDGVRPLGHLPPGEMLSWLAAAPIYALPARYEPFGLSVLEAALCGCALVLGEIATFRELWGDAAAYVPPDDPLALRDSLQRLINDPELRRRQGERARKKALIYSAERMTRAYLQLYSELLPRGSAKHASPGLFSGALPAPAK